MKEINALCMLLKENAEILENTIKIEYEKHEAIINDDINILDSIVEKEQVFYLEMKGIEQKRIKLVDSMGMKDKKMSQIISSAHGEDREKLQDIYDRLLKALNDFQKISQECRTLIEIKLHKINDSLNKLGYKENKDTLKNFMLSEKI